MLSECVIFVPKYFVVGKGKGRPITCPEGPEEEEKYSCTLSLPSALRCVGGQRHAPTAVPPGKTRYPLYRTVGGPQGRSGLMLKISPPPGFDPRTVHPVASRGTDRATPAYHVAVVSVPFIYI